MIKLQVEQLALCPRDPAKARELLESMGLREWAEDIVVADGHVFDEKASNTANLSFNYESDPMEKPMELEILDYKSGRNWMEGRSGVSHIGMHCTKAELREWMTFFKMRRIPVAQAVETQSHTNPNIAGKRTYKYVIFDTFDILGVDLKFIVRQDAK